MEKLSSKQLENILGGISAKEYCAQLEEIIVNNWKDMSAGSKKAAAYSYSKNC